MKSNNSLNPTRPGLGRCATIALSLPAMLFARIRARGLAQKGCAAKNEKSHQE